MPSGLPPAYPSRTRVDRAGRPVRWRRLAAHRSCACGPAAACDRGPLPAACPSEFESVVVVVVVVVVQRQLLEVLEVLEVWNLMLVVLVL